eukprot:TRINITY_DN2323_c0_g1_i5.p1 TRINITY_DN2323_c0_g1~~TRINITY_DN2323_c0_g1_i5.p1  ORF type:complete len:204 (-),score=43.33 TRINITY_DN2323_c0_g1_i5:319-930(-)
MYNPLISTSLALQPQDSIVSLSTASSSSSSSSSTSPDSKPSSTVSSRSASPIIFFEDDDYIIKDFSETSNTSLSYQPLISNNDIELLTATESTHSGADEFDSSFTNSQSPYTASSLYRQATIMDESSANLTDLSTDQWFAQKSSSSEPHSVDDQDNDDEQGMRIFRSPTSLPSPLLSPLTPSFLFPFRPHLSQHPIWCCIHGR